MNPFTDHIVKTFSCYQADLFKRISDAEWTGKNKHKSDQYGEGFYHPHTWCGKAGETLCQIFLPHFTVITQHFIAINKDMGFGGRIYEVKTKASPYRMTDKWQFSVGQKQFENNNNDIYIHCFYHLGTNEVRIVGWNWKDDFRKYGRLLRAGEIMTSGKPVTKSMWDIDYRYLRNLKEMPQ